MRLQMVLMKGSLLLSLIPGNQTSTATASPGFGNFEVRPILSERAKQRILNGQETIIVMAMFSGKPKSGALGSYFSDHEPDNLGDTEIEIPIGGVAKFGNVHFKQDHRNRIDEREPQVLINVFSGRKSSKNNLLACDVYEASLKQIEGRSIVLQCKLIGE